MNTSPRPAWFRLGRHDVRSTLPAPLRAIMQNGVLDRVFLDALLPDFLYPAIADSEPWAGGLGDTKTFTRTGLIAPNPVPITGSDPTPHTYGVEQWSVTMDQYGDTIDTNLLHSAMTLASKFLRDVQTLGINAGQTLNQIARARLYAAYGGGRTWATTAQGSASTTCVVADVSGFLSVMVNGVPVAVSPTNPLSVTVAGVANTVTAVNVGAKTLTLGTAVTQAIGDAVVAANAPVSVRPGSKATAFNLTGSDVATFKLFRAAVTRLRKQNVPSNGGYYTAHISPDTEAALFDDADFKQAAQGRVDSPIYRDLSIGRFGGIDWVRNLESPTVTVGSVTVQRPIVTGAGVLVSAPFEGMGSLLAGTGTEDVPDIRMIGPATGAQVALIVRPPQDRLQQQVSTTWSWVGDFGVPSDSVTGDSAQFKRAVVVEHA
ncbi:hypothetical protein Lfu02_79900 [Longispora fulva]|uniref:Uncharacterized protein n=1 Tax=Longispora fulva TaxID=619741 RepID=A0A8J7GPP4_9ACTN|nr:hypothetical protein [Longispora fulva]MBG6141127.1 hypothetical protein [Longispora fulva]GIG63618.1 hypothetical protein Lfu02_79900 [Longispora fulva]